MCEDQVFLHANGCLTRRSNHQLQLLFLKNAPILSPFLTTPKCYSGQFSCLFMCEDDLLGLPGMVYPLRGKIQCLRGDFYPRGESLDLCGARFRACRGAGRGNNSAATTHIFAARPKTAQQGVTIPGLLSFHPYRDFWGKFGLSVVTCHDEAQRRWIRVRLVQGSCSFSYAYSYSYSISYPFFFLLAPKNHPSVSSVSCRTGSLE